MNNYSHGNSEDRKVNDKKDNNINEKDLAKDNPFDSRFYYYWGNQWRDKRSNSMCARPYFRTNR